MNNYLFIIKTLTEMCRPILKNTVFFRSFGGQYNDNPKYVSEELHRRYPDAKIVWATGDGSSDSFPEYVKTVPIDSADYAKYIARAQVVVDNYCGCRTNYLKVNDPVKRLAFWILSHRRKGQFCLSTWHGTPLKHIALDEPQYKKSKFAKGYFNTDTLIAGCDVTANAFKTAFGWKREILMCGTPRNDILVNGADEGLKAKLGLPKDKKVFLFAPTFRNNVEMSGVCQLKELDIDGLLSTLGEKFGGDWCFVFRSHNLVMKAIQNESLGIHSEIINGNAFPDMAEYLAVSDALLTDYSSSMFDYMLTKRPTFLYTPDLFDYKNSERGFYFDIESTPFPISDNAADLVKSIADFDKASYEAKVEEFLVKIGNAEKGSAASAVVDEISKRIG